LRAAGAGLPFSLSDLLAVVLLNIVDTVDDEVLASGLLSGLTLEVLNDPKEKFDGKAGFDALDNTLPPPNE
jgi:hypothetical protein